ncbi:MAG: ABC transporter permease subunit [Beutenbergiaceae bacterium]
MTATATAPAAHIAARTTRLTFLHVLQSEWIKLFSVRSTPWVLGLSVMLMLGLSLLMGWGLTLDTDAVDASAESPGGEPLDPSSLGLMVATFSYTIGQIVFAVLGVMRITGEYSTGQIRSTLTACPTRLPVLVAKAIVVAVASFITGAITVALIILATTPMLEPHQMAIDLTDAETQQALLGVPLYLTAIALFALGIGGMLRHTAGAIATVLGVLMVLPIIGQINLEFVQDAALYLPSTAGQLLITGASPDGPLSPWQGYGVMMAWVVAALAGAAVLLRRRDA